MIGYLLLIILNVILLNAAQLVNLVIVENVHAEEDGLLTLNIKNVFLYVVLNVKNVFLKDNASYALMDIL